LSSAPAIQHAVPFVFIVTPNKKAIRPIALNTDHGAQGAVIVAATT
jgi:hypothetical protein